MRTSIDPSQKLCKRPIQNDVFKVLRGEMSSLKFLYFAILSFKSEESKFSQANNRKSVAFHPAF